MDVFGGVQETEEVNSDDDVLMDLMMSIREASVQEKCSFFNIVQKPLIPTPLSFEHYVVNFSEGILTKVRNRLSQRLSTK